jgi:hypothetical protein
VTSTADSETCLPAPATEGLGEVDRERSASLADEGGVSGARVEARDASGPVGGRPERREIRSWRALVVVAVGTAIAWLVARHH